MIGLDALCPGAPDVFFLDTRRFSTIWNMARDEWVCAIGPGVFVLLLFRVSIQPGPQVGQRSIIFPDPALMLR